MGSSNRMEKFRAAHAIRRNTGPGSTSPVGYTDPGGDTRTFTGNEKSAYVWSPPFADPLQTVWTQRPVQELYDANAGIHEFPRLDNGQYVLGTCFRPIDVTDYRIVTVVLQMETGRPSIGGGVGDVDPLSTLEILPIVVWDVLPGVTVNVETEPDLMFTPIGFVNPDVTHDQIPFTTTAPYSPQVPFPGDPDKVSPFSCRTVEPMCLRTTPVTTSGRAGWTQMALDFEVSSHRAFTLSIVPRINGQILDPQRQNVFDKLSLYYTRRT